MTIVAAPISNLVPGDSVNFTMTVTNAGPAPLGYFAIAGPSISGQLDVPNGVWNDCNMIISTGDATDGPFFILEWFPSGLVGENPMAAGETRTCHFTLLITSEAPNTYAYTIDLPDYWSDLNSSNNSATVVLKRALDPIPALSSWILALLATLIGGMSHSYRRRLSR